MPKTVTRPPFRAAAGSGRLRQWWILLRLSRVTGSGHPNLRVTWRYFRAADAPDPHRRIQHSRGGIIGLGQPPERPAPEDSPVGQPQRRGRLSMMAKARDWRRTVRAPLGPRDRPCAIWGDSKLSDPTRYMCFLISKLLKGRSEPDRPHAEVRSESRLQIHRALTPPQFQPESIINTAMATVAHSSSALCPCLGSGCQCRTGMSPDYKY